jgi:hypothetical protein
MSSIDFSELIISKKGVISSDNQPSGNIIGERGDNIIVEEGRSKVFNIPKSKIRGYDGTQLQLDFPFSELNNYMEKGEKTDDRVDNALDKVSNTINKVTDKTVDTASGTINKAKEVFRGKDDPTD